MADSSEVSAPANRNVSPITRLPSPAQTKAEDGDIRTTTGSEAQPSLSVLTNQEDTESLSGVETGRALSPSAPVVEEAVATTSDSHPTNIQSRCVRSFLEPQLGLCNSEIFDDDRHYISNFFGRNKSCSTSIPDDFYLVLCRKCMQAMKYRLKSDTEGTEIKAQVAAIKHALQNMAASGRWALVEVQLTKAEYDRRNDPAKYEEDRKKFNDDVIKSRENAKQIGEKGRRRNTKKPIVPVPDWLAEQVVRNKDDERQDYTPVNDREPTRWTFEDLITLVDMIGENCDVLPNIECLPITQGELDRVNVTSARTLRKEAKIEHEQLLRDITGAREKLGKDPKNKPLQEDLQAFRDAAAKMKALLEDAEEELNRALEVAAASEHTIPPKRKTHKKSGTVGESSKTVVKEGKKTKTTETHNRAREETHRDLDVHDETQAGEQSDHDMLDGPSPSPPPGWKGKGKATSLGPKTPSSQRKAKARSPVLELAPPTTPPPQTQTQGGSSTAASTGSTIPPTTPPQTQTEVGSSTADSTGSTIPHSPPNPSTIPLPTTPNQPLSTSPHTSTTRSAGRRARLVAEREQGQTQGQGVKRQAEDDDEQEPRQSGSNGATEQGSPVRKKFKRS